MSDKMRDRYKKMIQRRIEDVDFFDNFFDGDYEVIKRIINQGYVDLLFNEDNGEILIMDDELINIIHSAYVDYLQSSDISPKDKLLKIYKFVSNYFSDISYENGKVYLDVDTDDLSGFFDSYRSRDMTSADIVNNVYNSEDWYEPYDYFPESRYYYNEVIDDLNASNYVKLLEKMISESPKIPVNDEMPDELIDIANEQGHPDFIELNMEMLRLLDEDTFVYILKTFFDELYHELGWRHNEANNSAWVNEVYDRINDELVSLLGSKPERTPTKRRTISGNEKIVEVFRFDITSFFIDFITRFLDTYKDSSYTDDTLPYYNSFTSVVQEWLDRMDEKLKVSVPDYSSHSDVEKEFNEIIIDSL